MKHAIQHILLLYTDRYYLIKPVYPFGLDLVARQLRRAGYKVTLDYPFLPHAEPQKNLKDLLVRTQPDLIGLGLRNLDTTMSCEPYGNVKTKDFQALSFIPDLQALVAAIKSLCPHTPLIAGGGAFTVAPEAIMALLGIDFGIAGEGQAALLQFVQAYPDTASYAHIPNLVYKAANEYRQNPRRAFTFAGYGHFSHRAPRFNYAHETAGLPVQTKRGCNRHCSYCVEPFIEGRQFILRNPEDVVMELEALADTSPDAQTIFFVDTEFNTPDLNHCSTIIEHILKNSLQQRFRFASQFLPRPFNAALADLLSRAGFTIILTADSFADQVLEQNGIAFRHKDIIAAIELCQRFGIDCTINLIFGLPGETRQTLDQTIAWIDRYPPDHRRRYEYTCGARIYPQTPLYQRMEPASQNPHVYGSPSGGYLAPCFYCAPIGPKALKKWLDERLPFALDFHNDYDTITQQVMATGYLADGELWDQAVAQFKASALAAQATGYLYLVKKLASAGQMTHVRAILLHLMERIKLDDRAGQYAEAQPVIQYYLNILATRE